MKKTWVKNTVCALVALAMVFGLWFAIGEKAANAAVSSAAIVTPASTNLAFNESITLTATVQTNPTGETVTGVWEIDTTTSTVTDASITAQTATTCTIKAGTTAGDIVVKYSADTNPSVAPMVATPLTLTVNAASVAGTHTMKVGDQFTPTVSYADGGGTTNFTVSVPAGNNIVSLLGNTKTIQAINKGSVVIQVNTGSQAPLSITVQVDPLTPTFSLVTPMGTSSSNPKPITVGETFVAEVATNYDGQINWTSSDSSIVGIAKNGDKTAIVTGATVGGPVTLTATATGSTRFTDASLTFYVIVGSPATVTVGATSVKIPTVNTTATVNASVSGGGNLTAYSSDPTVATVSYPNATSGTLTITGLKAGSAAITVGGTSTGSTKTIIVVVGNIKPVTTLSFSPNVTTLAKGDSTVMTIHVDNPIVRSDGNGYAKVALANRRVVVSDYNYSKVSDREYWVRLDSNGNATVTIKPQYNGSVKVTVTADDAAAASKTFTVTGHPTLPQTGQDFTLIYVFGACCLVAVGTWVVLYARKKKNSRAA